MQAALITYLPTAPNGTEPSGEIVSAGHNTAGHKATGQGMRISSALQSRENDALFTKILEKGITINTALGFGAGDIQLMADTHAGMEADGEESADICSLLMQLMVMNSADQAESGDTSQKAQDEKAVNGILGIINEIPDTSAGTAPHGLENAASVLLQNDGKAADALSALASSKAAAENNGLPAGLPEGNPSSVPFEAVMAGITDALKNELNQQDAPQTAQAAATKATEVAGDVATAEAAVTAGLAENSTGLNTPVSAGAKGKTLSSRAENDGLQASGQTSESAIKTTDNTISGVSPAGGNNDSDGGLDSPDARSKRKDIGFSAVNRGLNGAAAPETGLKSETAAEKAVAVERALNRFADDIMSVRGGAQEIRIVLEPESLGVLTISVIKTESGISARIKSEDREIAAIISDHVQKLISSMESKGITVRDVDVTYSQTEQNTSFNQNGFSQAREDSSKRSALPPEKNTGDDASPEVWQALYGTEASGDTLVDYRV